MSQSRWPPPARPASLKDPSGGIFRPGLVAKEVYMTVESLENLASNIIAGHLPPLETLDLCLVGLSQPVGVTTFLQQTIDILARAFDGLASGSGPSGMLASLSLKVVLIDGQGRKILPANISRGLHTPFPTDYSSTDPKKPLMDLSLLYRASMMRCASETLDMVLQALSKSRLQVEDLNCFHSADMQECSLPCDSISATAWQTVANQTVFQSTKSLSLRICNPLQLSHFRLNNNDAETGLAGFFAMMGCFPSLENLDITYARIHVQSRPDLDLERDAIAIMAYLTHTIVPSHLTFCRLRGFATNETTLLNFLKTKPSKYLLLEFITLLEGNLEPILDYCFSPEARLEGLVLDTLQSRQPVQPVQPALFRFLPMALFQTRIIGRGIWVGIDGHHCERVEASEDEIKSLSYRVALDIPMDSPRQRPYHRYKHLEFGGWIS